LDEAKRFTPPVLGILPRILLPGARVIDGHAIPEGTEIGVSAYAIHHNPAVYKDPFRYRPERCLEDGGTGQSRGGRLLLLVLARECVLGRVWRILR
jgi:cytochrome P450